MTDYQKQAEDFLTKTNTTLTIKFKKYDKYFTDDKECRNIYTCTLKRNNEKYSFTFGQSIACTEKNIKPTAYDILSCLEKYQFNNFKEFCSEYGYDPDSRKAEKIYKACDKQASNIISMFGEDDSINELREIC